MTVTAVLLMVLIVIWSLPRWLPPAVVRLREWIFARVNGAEGIGVPGPLVGAEDFERVYSDPAADGPAVDVFDRRSIGPVAALCVLSRVPKPASGTGGAHGSARASRPAT